MDISRGSIGNWVVLEISGRIDALTGPELEREIDNNVSSGKINLALDFSRVDYLSSAGLRVLLKADNLCQSRGGKLALVSISDFVSEVLEVSNFASMLTIFNRLDNLS